MTRAAAGVLAALACWALPAAGPCGPGEGYGESLRVHSAASRAGTGGIGLEENSFSGGELATNQAYIDLGVRWISIDFAVEVVRGTRVGIEGLGVFTEGSPGTSEREDGTFGGETEGLDASEMGFGAFVRQRMFHTEAFSAALRIGVRTLHQDISGSKGDGAAGEGGIIISAAVHERVEAMLWADTNPIGAGKEADFSTSFRGGAGINCPGGLEFAGGGEGFMAGLEWEQLGEGLAQYGGGLAYWFGTRERYGDGVRMVVRSGIRGVQGSVSPTQMRFGLGFEFKSEYGFGGGIDYALVPMGELGNLHYFSARVLLGGPLFRDPMTDLE